MEIVGYKGHTANIPLGTLGVLSDAAPGAIPPTALIRAYNVDFGPGYIQKAAGSLRYNRTVLPSGIVALIDYWPDPYVQRLIAATADGKVYRDTGDRLFGGATSIFTFPNSNVLNTKAQFLVGGAEVAGNPHKLFLFSDGVALPYVLSGDASTFNAISNPASDWVSTLVPPIIPAIFPKFGLIHRGRLWAFAKNRYYASTTASHEDFTTTGYLSGTIGPGDGGDCIAAYIYKGKMIVFKEGDVAYFLNDTDVSSTNWYFARLGEGLGVASPHAAIQVLDDLLVGNNTGSVTSYQATQAYGDIKSGDILRSAKVNQFYRENTTYSGFPYMHALWYPEKHLALFTARTKANTKNDAIIVIDIQNPDAPRYSLNTKDSADCLALRKDIHNIQRPIYGAADGYVYLMDKEDRLLNTSAYTGEFRTPHLDFRFLDAELAHKNKTYDFLGVTFQEEGAHDLSVDVYIDGQLSQTLTFTQTIGTNYLGAFVLGTSKLGVEDEKTIWNPINGSGRRIGFRCYNSGSNENFKVSQLTVGFTITGEDATTLVST